MARDQRTITRGLQQECARRASAGLVASCALWGELKGFSYNSVTLSWGMPGAWWPRGPPRGLRGDRLAVLLSRDSVMPPWRACAN